MKSESMSYYKRLAIAGVIVLVAIFAVVLVSMPKQSSNPVSLSAHEQQLKQLEQADENMIAAALDVYYANTGEYPLDVQSAMQFQDEQNKDVVQGGIDRMTTRHMVYIVRSDRESYTFSYKSVNTQTVKHEGNYRETYQ